MADRVNISELSSALDTYLDKIERVRLSKTILEEHAAAIADLVSAVDILSEKVSSLEAAGSSRAGLVSDIRSGLLSGSDVSTLLSRESRAAAMRPDGVSGLSLSDVQHIKSASGAVPLLQGGGTSIGMLRSLSAWGSAAGGPPSPGGMFSAMESRMLGLGVGLTRGGSASLVADIEGDSVREEMLSSAEDIHEGTEALLEALASRKTPQPAVTTAASDKKPVVPQSEKTSWWDTLKTVGLVVGAATGVFGLLGNDSVQRFIQENLLSAEGRQALWGKLQSIFDSVSTGLSRLLSLGERISAGVQKVLQLQGATGEDIVKKAATAGLSTYNALPAEEQSAVRSFQSDYESTLSSPAPLPAGISSAEVSALRSGMGSLALRGFGAFASVKTASSGYKALRSVYRAARGASAAGKAASLMSSFRTMYSMGKFSLWGLAAGAVFDAAHRRAFNVASMLAAQEEGSSVAFHYPEYGGGSEPELIALGSLPVEQDDGSTTALYNTLTKEEQLGYTTTLMGDLSTYRQEQNKKAILQGIISTGNYITLDSGKVIRTSELEDLEGEALDTFLEQNPGLAGVGLRNAPVAFANLASEQLIHHNDEVYVIGENDPILESMSPSDRQGYYKFLKSGKYKTANPRTIASKSRLSTMFNDASQDRLFNGTINRGAAHALNQFTGLSNFALRLDSGFKGSDYRDTLEGFLDKPQSLPKSLTDTGGQAHGLGTVLAPPEVQEQARGSKAQGVTINSASPTSLTYVYHVGGNSQEGAER